jgi:hypothetical protein
MKAVVKMESKLMKFPNTNETSMREMYEAAASVFELPSFGSVMAYLQGVFRATYENGLPVYAEDGELIGNEV